MYLSRLKLLQFKNISELSLTIGPGFNFIIGNNGVGKTTFLNILLGLEKPDSGKINHGETVVFGYFDQKGLEMKEDKRVIEYVREFAEHFTLADGTKVSAGQFLQLFQFQ